MIQITKADRISSLRRGCEAIEQMIWEEYADHSGRCAPIPDGVVDIERYLAAPLKVLWILNEPYDGSEDGIPTGGGWLYRDFLCQPNFYESVGAGDPTWEPITYVTYSILNGFLQWEQMDQLRDKPGMVDVLRSASFINISKLPGLTTSKHVLIRRAYQKYCILLLQQVTVYQPDIIIGGNTLQFFNNDLALQYPMDWRNESAYVAVSGSQVFVDAYHPAQRKIKRSVYVNGIVENVQRALAKLGKI